MVCGLFLFLELFRLRLESLESLVMYASSKVSAGFGSHQFAAVGGEKQNQHVFIVGCFGLDYLKSYVRSGDGARKRRARRSAFLLMNSMSLPVASKWIAFTLTSILVECCFARGCASCAIEL